MEILLYKVLGKLLLPLIVLGFVGVAMVFGEVFKKLPRMIRFAFYGFISLPWIGVIFSVLNKGDMGLVGFFTIILFISVGLGFWMENEIKQGY
ncbi:hypothetical protein WKK05_34995 [Nostoc sp. UHCC 0302]|uniref:hypothetical protein n=1 Tax=Nostoc sp. UHCC 0302 TaxID=3134896 RepID=UPI00311CC874